jgi:hypothetical protein
MANEKYKLTEQQLTALKPLVDKLESAYNELEKAVTAAGVRRDNPDEEFGFCFRCPKPGRQELCSSFKGPGKTMNERCQRDFCGHPRFAHF